VYYSEPTPDYNKPTPYYDKPTPYYNKPAPYSKPSPSMSMDYYGVMENFGALTIVPT
jgi:hypothetical protein